MLLALLPNTLKTMELIDGKATAAAIKKEIAEEVEQLVANGQKRPHLAAVLVGHDGGSETYVRNKVLACEACGFESSLIRYEADVTEEELLAAGITPTTVRLSIGIEHIDDILADLEQGFEAVK